MKRIDKELRKVQFLEALKETGTIDGAHKMMHIGFPTVYQYMEDDADFATAVRAISPAKAEDDLHWRFEEAREALGTGCSNPITVNAAAFFFVLYRQKLTIARMSRFLGR